MPRGGPRPGAGRKPSPEKAHFRALLREKFEDPKTLDELWKRAWGSDKDTLLYQLLTQAYGQAPQSGKFEVSIPDGITVYTAQTATGDPASPAPAGLSADVSKGAGA